MKCEELENKICLNIISLKYLLLLFVFSVRMHAVKWISAFSFSLWCGFLFLVTSAGVSLGVSACPPSILHFKMSQEGVEKIKSQNPLQLSFQKLIDLNMKRKSLQNEILELEDHDPNDSRLAQLKSELETTNSSAREEFLLQFKSLNNKISKLNHLTLEQKYTLWHAYIDQSWRWVDFWGVSVIYSTPLQIICRGAGGNHVLRFTADGGLYKGELDERVLSKIEEYGAKKAPHEYNIEVSAMVSGLMKI